MLKVTTASEINTILSEDDAAVYKEGVEYSVIVPSKLAAQMRRKLIFLGLRELPLGRGEGGPPRNGRHAPFHVR
jgi:hypothetical protein